MSSTGAILHTCNNVIKDPFLGMFDFHITGMSDWECVALPSVCRCWRLFLWAQWWRIKKFSKGRWALKPNTKAEARISRSSMHTLSWDFLVSLNLSRLRWGLFYRYGGADTAKERENYSLFSITILISTLVRQGDNADKIAPHSDRTFIFRTPK